MEDAGAERFCWKIVLSAGFDKINEHDTGIVTCEAQDSQRNESLSAPIRVKPRSKLLINPLSATVMVGNSFSITCVSKMVCTVLQITSGLRTT
ncbi:hypothetical protein CEXT_41261 [Caerostris extrusa]|uniref:Uncharacterized protein n=1 Tax=Caerostris extrusa TaxID=172846 RepID=A0AAV4QB23_CAEEX|nr:hypothetical protein CEXT_41261 [Caerostris extrusa]